MRTLLIAVGGLVALTVGCSRKPRPQYVPDDPPNADASTPVRASKAAPGAPRSVEQPPKVEPPRVTVRELTAEAVAEIEKAFGENPGRAARQYASTRWRFPGRVDALQDGMATVAVFHVPLSQRGIGQCIVETRSVAETDKVSNGRMLLWEARLERYEFETIGGVKWNDATVVGTVAEK